MSPANVVEGSVATSSPATLVPYGYNYKTTNAVNGKIYIGQHKGEFNPAYLGSGVAFRNAVRKYGKHSFSVKFLISGVSVDDLNETEIRLIGLHRKLLGKNRLYNLAAGGMNKIPLGDIGQRISKAKKGKPNGLKGIPKSEETKLRIGEANKGTVHSAESVARQKVSRAWYVMTEESRQKLAVSAKEAWTPERHAAAKGKPAWNKGKGSQEPVNTAPKTGRHQSPEHLAKRMAARRLQGPPSEETKKKISATLIARSIALKQAANTK